MKKKFIFPGILQSVLQLLNSLIDEESSGAGGDVKSLVLVRDDMQIEQVTLHLSLAVRRIPSTECQLFQAVCGRSDRLLLLVLRVCASIASCGSGSGRDEWSRGRRGMQWAER